MKRTSKLSAIFNNAKFLNKVYGPELKLGFGLGLIAAGFVMAIKATKDPAEEIQEAENKLIELHEKKDTHEYVFEPNKYWTDLGGAYGNLCKGYLKTYGLSALCVIAGTGLIVKSHKDLRDSQVYYAGLAGAFSKELNDLYSRLEDKYGKEETDRLRYGMEEQEIEVSEKDENGKDKLVKKKVNVISPDYNGFYTYRWNETSSTYKKNPLLRAAYLEQMNAYANDILRIRKETSPGKKMGYLWLNELLTDMDIRIREEGQFTGWLLMDNNYSGDNYVEITETRAYETNPETGIMDEISLLTFNVDGNIMNRMFPKSRTR